MLFKKSTINDFWCSLYFSGSLIITLLDMASLYASSQVTEVQQYVRLSQNAIQQYEQAGNYAKALKIARNAHKESLKLGLTHEVDSFSKSVKRLEEELLALGSSRLLFDENYQPRVKLLSF